MKRTLLASVALATLAVLVVGCVTQPLPAPPGLTGSATAPAPVSGTPLGLASITPETQPVTDFNSLVNHLRSAGATVDLAGDTTNSIFHGQGHIIKVNGGEVQAFEYSDAAAANAEAARISPDGSRIDNSLVDWPAPPHFYHEDRVLAVYVGNDVAVINPMEFVMGRQFAGSPVSGTPPPPVAETTGTAAPGTATPAVAAATAAPAANCTDRALMTQDVTYPDNSPVSAGQSLVKTWRLQNTGTCTWNTSYALAFVKGTAMGAPASVPLTKNVAPGTSIDMSVNMIAPGTAGTYRGNWQVRNAAGKLFAITNSLDGTFWVQILVTGSQPTAVTSPTPPGAQRINFPPGSTGITIFITPPANGTITYLLAATAGQELHVGAGGPGIVLVVHSPNGAPVNATSVDANGLSVFPLTQTGDYSLVFSGTPNQVTLIIPAAAPPTATPTPASAQRITFPPGSTTITFPVQPPANGSATYLLRAQAGQEMHIGLNGSNFAPAVADPNGQPVNSTGTDAGGLAVYPLAAAGDYSLTFSGGPVQVTITIPAPVTNTPERITFPAGVSGVTRDLNLSAGQTKRYVLGAQANQTMHVVISQPGYTLTVFDPNGAAINPLNSGSGRYDYRLALTGDYILALQGSGANSISIEIPPAQPVTRQRITFAAGANSATVSFTLGGTQTQEYLLGARAGQHMLINLAQPGTSVLLIGPDGRVVSPLSVDATGQKVSYQLALTGDFVISLQGASNTMTVQIP